MDMQRLQKLVADAMAKSGAEPAEIEIAALAIAAAGEMLAAAKRIADSLERIAILS